MLKRIVNEKLTKFGEGAHYLANSGEQAKQARGTLMTEAGAGLVYQVHDIRITLVLGNVAWIAHDVLPRNLVHFSRRLALASIPLLNHL